MLLEGAVRFFFPPTPFDFEAGDGAQHRVLSSTIIFC